MGEITKVWLNTWGNYNDGHLGYGWMTPEEAEEFIEDNPERDGGEWFIADIDDYIGIDFPNLNYRSVFDILELLKGLEELDEYAQKCLIAVMHDNNVFDLEEALSLSDRYTFYEDWEAYHDSCEEALGLESYPEIFQRYFDYVSFYRDCDFDAHEAENGIILVA